MEAVVALNFRSPEGVQITVPIDTADMSDAERVALLRLAASQRGGSMSEEDRQLVGKREFRIPAEGLGEGIICRFDLRCIKL
jgi:hypothetical protein